MDLCVLWVTKSRQGSRVYVARTTYGCYLLWYSELYYILRTWGREGECVLRKATKDDDICLSSFLLVYLVCTGSPRIRQFLSFVCLNRALGSLGVFMDGFYHWYIRAASVRKATKVDNICLSCLHGMEVIQSQGSPWQNSQEVHLKNN